MSKIVDCKFCGQKISIRKMPGGQWVAFDYHTSQSHLCGKTNKKEYGSYKNKTSDTLTDYNDILDEIEYAIDEKIILELTYNDVDGDKTNRKVRPVSLLETHSPPYLEAFCLLRDDRRHFRVDRIEKLKTTSQNFSQNYRPSRDNVIKTDSSINNSNSDNSEENDETPLSAEMWKKANEEPIIKEKIVEKKVYIEKEESGWSQLFKWIGIITVIIILFRMCAG